MLYGREGGLAKQSYKAWRDNTSVSTEWSRNTTNYYTHSTFISLQLNINLFIEHWYHSSKVLYILIVSQYDFIHLSGVRIALVWPNIYIIARVSDKGGDSDHWFVGGRVLWMAWADFKYVPVMRIPQGCQEAKPEWTTLSLEGHVTVNIGFYK